MTREPRTAADLCAAEAESREVRWVAGRALDPDDVPSPSELDYEEN